MLQKYAPIKIAFIFSALFCLSANVYSNNDDQKAFALTSDNFRFAAAVAEFGMLLRHSAFKGNANYEQVIGLARKAKGSDDEGYRAEFIRLVESASSLAGNQTTEDTKEDSGGLK